MPPVPAAYMRVIDASNAMLINSMNLGVTPRFPLK